MEIQHITRKHIYEFKSSKISEANMTVRVRVCEIECVRRARYYLLFSNIERNNIRKLYRILNKSIYLLCYLLVNK